MIRSRRTVAVRPFSHALALALALAAPAAASPLGDPAIERIVFGGSTAPHPTSLVVNPGALALTTGTHVHASGWGTADHVRIDRRTIDPATGELADGPSAAGTVWSPGVMIGAYTVTSTGRFAAGIQGHLPTAEERLEDEDLAYHTLGGRHRDIVWATLGGAYRWRGLMFGASIQLVESRLHLHFARDTALDDGRAGIEGDCGGEPCGLEHPAAREVYRIDTASTRLPSARNTIAATFGGVARLAEGWWLGIAYTSPPGLYSEVETTGVVSVTRAERDGGGRATGKATVRFTLPQKLRLGVRGRVTPGLDLVVEARWEQLSSFRRYDVRLYGLDLTDAGIPELVPRPRGLRDELALQLGLEQVDTGQRAIVGARLGAERGPVGDAHLSPLQPYPAAITGDLGLQLRVAPAFIVQIGYGVRWSPATDSGRGAYDPLDAVACYEASFDIDLPACQALRDGYAIPTASGTYQRIENLARVTLRWALP